MRAALTHRARCGLWCASVALLMAAPAMPRDVSGFTGAWGGPSSFSEMFAWAALGMVMGLWLGSYPRVERFVATTSYAERAVMAAWGWLLRCCGHAGCLRVLAMYSWPLGWLHSPEHPEAYRAWTGLLRAGPGLVFGARAVRLGGVECVSADGRGGRSFCGFFAAETPPLGRPADCMRVCCGDFAAPGLDSSAAACPVSPAAAVRGPHRPRRHMEQQRHASAGVYGTGPPFAHGRVFSAEHGNCGAQGLPSVFSDGAHRSPVPGCLGVSHCDARDARPVRDAAVAGGGGAHPLQFCLGVVCSPGCRCGVRAGARRGPPRRSLPQRRTHCCGLLRRTALPICAVEVSPSASCLAIWRGARLTGCRGGEM